MIGRKSDDTPGYSTVILFSGVEYNSIRSSLVDCESAKTCVASRTDRLTAISRYPRKPGEADSGSRKNDKSCTVSSVGTPCNVGGNVKSGE